MTTSAVSAGHSQRATLGLALGTCRENVDPLRRDLLSCRHGPRLGKKLLELLEAPRP